MASLDPQEQARYARQVRLPQVGTAGQAALKASSVLIVGAGGLGSPAALYLVAAGIGRIGIADGDRVDITNLQRQILYGMSDVGRAKTDSAAQTLRSINPHISVETIPERVTSANALDLVSRFDVVIDGTDNFPTRYLLSDACVLTATPLVYGSVDRFEGQVSVFVAKGGPCYRCLFPSPPEPGTVQNCADAGVLGVLPGLVGTAQATEVLKLLLGIGEPLVGRLLMVDALRMSFRTIGVERDPACPACGTREIRELIDYEAFCAGPPAPDTSTTDDTAIATITPRELAQALQDGHSITLIDVREPYEWNFARISGAKLIPLGTLERALGTIEPNADVVVYCHHGTRSEMAAYALRDAGIRRVRNLVGGIDRWSREVDPSVPRY
jgi:molybdopterin/thiamine biosynthesis adenylyltransferase/rhodanese-related sulfurtransferase